MQTRVTITLPERLLRRLRELNVDLEAYVVDVLTSSVCDPDEEVEVRLELAERFMREARECLEKGDAVQASEKLYKVAEECIKALAVKYGIPEALEARREGRWWTKLLSRAAKTLSRKLGEPVINCGWCIAYDLHVWGFHEASLSVDHVRESLPHIEELLRRTQQILHRSRGNTV